MNILITGGLGTIGRALAEECRARGHQVTSCDLSHETEEIAWSLETGDQAHYARCDVSEWRQLVRLFEHCGPFDLVYHCAAEFGRWNGEDFYEQLWRTNVIGTKHILRLQQDLGFKLVFFSSSEVYGDWPALMSESVMDNFAIPQLNDYAMTKWVGELQVRNAARQFETQTVIVRLFNTYGPGEYYTPYRSVNCRLLYRALHRLPWTVYRGHRRCSTYLQDTVHTLANISTSFHPGAVYNIGSGEDHSIEELSELVCAITGAPESLVHYENQEVLTTVTKVPDISRAQHELGHYTSCDLRRGMTCTAIWMRDTYRETIDESVHLYGHV